MRIGGYCHRNEWINRIIINQLEWYREQASSLFKNRDEAFYFLAVPVKQTSQVLFRLNTPNIK
ncbi:hypothetical protein GCM10011391_18840 [Pullulanibacillus camelliae]|uniref:Uncharacterized protein n=1 Tax=Pullulanibacillus camelliae TaxID=1707096 RepID=A0A8J2YGM9_9BACL|nr:hypothetical protein GCM10011391_18840 [Pullulanibacillus camelliae]